ncbi:TetR/AcrR family transcriptional regulator [Aquitalea sp. LB_tupeE]|uniref:TetR/AcrR family transcriptional regulator n=1 Tax=Aquitalea sp. LB_tupeE TaxID=2748078 RepID=UPI0015BD75D6|nr:TetR/AcrR family transcriptional regulator [Aquitalea sp. LB_tupeE]NWK79906.1 TetR/AcrR family transcriptional regulator [Aquitalea sp. LB_tupeE]
MRKTPKQERSSQSVETIYQAVAKILDEEEFSKFSTNKLARVSGFSIGTIYQYFANKDSVLISMIHFYHIKIIERFVSYLQGVNVVDVALEQALDGLVDLAIDAYCATEKWKKSLQRIGWLKEAELESQQGYEQVGAALHDMVARYHQSGQTGIKPPDKDLQFIILRSVCGCLRYAALQNYQFEDALLLRKSLKSIVLTLLHNE